MKSMLVSEIFPPQTGGSGRWFYEIYRRLPRQDYAIAAGEHSQAAEFDRTHDLCIHRLPLCMSQWGIASLPGLRGYWRGLRGLRRIIKCERPALLHCGRCLPEGVMALALRELTGLRYACYVHGEDIGMAATSRELRFLVSCVFANAEYAIANSRNTARMLREEWGLAAERVHILHPGVDTTRFTPAARDEDFRAAMGWSGRRVLLTVGRLQLRKGQDMLIRALSSIRKRVPEALCVLAGDGEEMPRLRELARQEGVEAHVQFLGEVTDARLIKCYQQCDLFVLPNRQVGRDIEGFGMVLLEAQACGKPVVAGDSGGTAETMNIPHTGCVVDCTSPLPLADTLSGLLQDPDRLAAMSAAARPWVVDQFDWESLAEQAAELFYGATSHAQPPASVEAVLS
jgi:phosphatidylinositol alpha-1,6-mannosyltransferase